MRIVQISDSYDGQITCSDGNTYTSVICRDEIVYTKGVMKDSGSTEGRWDNGDRSWLEFAYAANVHLEMARVASSKFHRKENPTEAGWDEFSISSEELKMFQDHPDHHELVDVAGLELEDLGEDRFRVNVSKFYTKN